MNGQNDIRRSLHNIVSLAVFLLALTTVCWFYEPVLGHAMTERGKRLVLGFYMIMLGGILGNVKTIRKSLQGFAS